MDGKMKHCEQQKVWQCIVKEARQQSEQEPMLASFYHATIINHESLGAALSYILANKLKTASMPAMAVREVVEQAFKQDQSIIDAAACDICATVNRDPAVEMYSMPLLYLKATTLCKVTEWLTGCGSKAVSHLPLTYKTKSLLLAKWIFTLQLVSVKLSCSTTRQAL